MWEKNPKILGAITIISFVIGLMPLIQGDIKTGLLLFSALCLIIGLSLYLYDKLLERGPKLKQISITQQYQILDEKGLLTKVRFERYLKVRHRTVEIGGNGWTAPMRDIRHFIQYEGSSEELALTTIEHQRSGRQFFWDEIFNPPLKRGDKIKLVSEFVMESEFNSKVCSDNFHAYRPIGNLCFEVRFPIIRPAKRWWIMTDYANKSEDNSVLFESREETTNIKWNGPAKSGGIYYIYWEW